MKVLAVIEHDEYYPVALLKIQENIDMDFANEARNLSDWSKSSREEILEIQTYVAWLRANRSYYKDKSVKECLNSDGLVWDTMEVQEV